MTDEVVRSWDERAAAYALLTARWPIFETLAGRLVDAVTPALAGDPAPRILDLGCGNGLVAARWVRRHPRVRVSALDPAPAMLERARRTLERELRADDRRRITFHALPAERVAELGGGFAGGTCSAALHLIDEREALPALGRCLDAGACFAFNLWWHAFEETAAIEPSTRWRDALDATLARAGHAPEPRAERASRVRRRDDLQRLAARAGLHLEGPWIDRDPTPAAFLLEFAAMSPAFLAHVPPSQRPALVAGASEALADESVELVTARFALRRPREARRSAGDRAEPGAGPPTDRYTPPEVPRTQERP